MLFHKFVVYSVRHESPVFVTPMKRITTREALNIALKEEMRDNKNIFVIGEEVGISGGPYGVTNGLLEEFGSHRVVDAPISEIGFTGLAIGAALNDLHPVVDFMSMGFSLQAADQIINTCSKLSYMSGPKMKCPIVFRGPSGANFGYAAQHTQEFYSFYGSVPGLVVVAPFTPLEHKYLLRSALKFDGPVVFLENEMLYSEEEVESENNTPDELPLGKARVLREGVDVTVVALSYSLKMVLEAVEESNHDVEVVNLISVQPLDLDSVVNSVMKTGCLVIVDFGPPCFGIASEVSAKVYDRLYGKLTTKIVVLTAKNQPVPYSESQEKDYYPKKDDLIETIDLIVSRKDKGVED